MPLYAAQTRPSTMTWRDPTSDAVTGPDAQGHDGVGTRVGLLLGADGHQGGASVPKTETGIPGFDHVAMGGLPLRRATVVAGPAGSAKTILAGQFLAEGVRRGQPGVFVTLEEPAVDLRANLATLGFEVQRWEDAGDWRFVDASPPTLSGTPAPYNMTTLAAQIGHAVDATGAERLVLDSLNAVLSLQSAPGVARQELRSLVAALRAMGLTTLLTVETRDEPSAGLSHLGIEEFVADNVVLLRNAREGAFRRRTVEVLKMRGAMHHKGEVAFTVLPGRGLVVLPVTAPHQAANVGDTRVGSGVAALDEMTSGGFFQGASVLVTGPTGAGKTLLATEFAAQGCRDGEKVLLLAYEETREQIFRNASGWGHDFAAHEAAGRLTIVSHYPEIASLEDHLVEINELIERERPARLIIDSLSALERLGSTTSYRTFVIGVTSAVKRLGLATLMTASSPHLSGGLSVAESHISGLIDGIVSLRYVEVGSELRRGLLVLKVRGSSHSHEVREFTIDESGMRLRGLFPSQYVGSDGST